MKTPKHVINACEIFSLHYCRTWECFTVPSGGGIINDTTMHFITTTQHKHFTFNSVAVAVRTILALEGWYVMWKAAAVDGRALLHEEVWRRHRWGHECGFRLCWKKPEPLAADVEACRADEGAPMSGRTWTGCNRPGYWRSWRGAWGWWAAPRLQGEVVWAKKSSEMSKEVL